MESVLAWLAGILAAIWPADGGPRAYYGYVEADTVLVAPARSGTLAEVAAREGTTVEAGALLFRLDDRKEVAEVEAAEARLAAAKATLADRRAGSRPEEVAVIADTLMRARADLELARANFDRSERLKQQGVVSAAQYDRDQSALRSAEARVSEVGAQLTVARLPARADQIAAAEAEVRAARAELARLRVAAGEMRTAAPVGGRVEDVYFDAGEQAGPATPVVSLLPDGALKVRFFVATGERGAFAPGAAISIGCEGCAERVPATVTRVASEAEFTPPVIYSLDERARLVFAVEALPSRPDPALQPGQPVDVRPAP